MITLNLGADAVQDPKAQGKLEGKLEERLAARPDIALQLEALIASLPKPEGKANTSTQIGSNNINVQDVHGSTVTIEK